ANYGISYGIDKAFSKSSSSISVQNSKLSNGISSQNMNIFSFNDNGVYKNIIHKGKFEEKVLSSGETASYFSVVNTLPINSKWSIDYIDTLQIASKLYTQSIQPYLVADNYLNYLFNTQNYENVSLGMSYNDENNSGIFADSKIGYTLFGSNQLGGGENYFTTLYIDSKVGINLNIMTNWSVKLYAEPMVVQNIIGINLVPNYSMIVGLNMGYHY
ncbi:MAG: hypothetical protein NTX05_04600, partial [Fusobacteria bacterium]|nr:hypothetical protein [Fusobacteriota bacterium]